MSLIPSLVIIFVVLSSTLINYFSCAVIDNNIKLETRIFNGDETDISTVPFIVFLKIRLKHRNGENICGGVILDNASILTAAHCLENSIGVQIIAGSSNPLSDGNVQRRVGTEIIIHPEYTYDRNKNTTVYDFAIIKLRTNFTVNRNVKPAFLPYTDDEINFKNDQIGKVCGWGSTNENTALSPTLLCTSTHILTNAYCDSLQRKIQLSHHMICSGRSSCQGDSGSGLIYNGVVVGIVSFTLGPCNYAVPPVVYGKISSVLDFIRNYTNIHDSKTNVTKDDRIFFPQ